MAITFMAKYDAREGNSCHIHLSLRRTTARALFARDEAAFERFIAGQLACLRELTLFYAPNVNSYKRFATGSFAPDRGGLGPRQPHVRGARRRPRRRAAARAARAGRRRQPVPRAGGDDRRGPARARRASWSSSRALEGNAYVADKPHVPATLAEARELFADSDVARSRVRRGGRRRTTSTTPASSSRPSRPSSPTGSARGGSSGCDRGRGLRAGPVHDRVRGDAGAARHRDQARAAAARARGCPPERDLCEQLGIARSTLRQALTALVQSGHLHAVRGRGGGTFVADAPLAAPPRRRSSPTGATAATCGWRSSSASRALAAERADADAIDALRALVDAMAAARRRLRRLPARRRALPRRRSPRRPAPPRWWRR